MSPSHAKHKELPHDLRQALESLSPHDHLCLIYETPEEWKNAVIPFIRIGIERGEKCIYVVDAHTAKEVQQYLKQEGIDVTKAEKSGQLTILHESEAYTKEGSFDPDRMIQFLISETRKAISEGYPALRVTGEMTWMLKGLPGSEKIIEYEAKLNRDLFPKYPCLAICQYDRRKFDPEIIKGVVLTHPLLIRGNKVYRNFYYIPTEEFLSVKRAETETSRLLNNLEKEAQIMKDLREKEQTLRESEERFARVAEQMHEMVWEVDAEGLYTYVSRGCELIMGYKPEEMIKKMHFYDHHPEEGRDAFKQAAFAIFERKEPFRELPNAVMTKDGREVWVSTNGIPMLDNQGNLIGYSGSDYDITDRLSAEQAGKRAEEALRQSEEKYRSIFENAVMGIFRTTPDGHYLSVNPAGARMYGYKSPEEMIQSVTDMAHQIYVHPEDRKRFKELLEISGFVEGFEAEHYSKDGSKIWASMNARIVRDTSGTILYYETTSGDITSRKRAEIALIESESKFKNLVEGSIAGVYIIQDGVFKYVNQRCAEIHGYTVEEMVGKLGVKETTLPDDLPIVEENIRKRLSGETVTVHFTFRVVGKDKKVVHIEVYGSSMMYQGKPAVIGTLLDITDLKKAEEELRSAHRQLFDIIDSLPDATFVIDRDKRVVAWNRAIEEMTGIPKEEMLGKGDYAYAIPFYGERRPITIDLLFETDVDIEKKYDFVHKIGNTYFAEAFIPGMYDGKGAYLWASASKLFDAKGNLIGAMESIRDITERKNAETLLWESEEKYRSIFENAVEGIFQTTPDGHFISVNPALAGMMGFDSPEQMIKTFTDIAKHHYVIPEERMRYRRLLEEQGFVKAFEAEVYRKDGSKIWISISARAMRDRSGRVDHYEGTIVDITSRKEAELAIQKAYQTTHSIIENAPFEVYIVNEEGLVEYAHIPMDRIAGIDIEQFNKINILNFPAYQNLGLADKIKSALRGIPFSMGPLEYITHHSNKRTIRKFTGVPIEEIDKRKVLVFVEDLTELKSAEEQLRKERETFFSIIENSPDSIILIGSDGRFNYVNPEFTHMTGYTIEDVPDGKQWFKKAFPDSKYRKLIIDAWREDLLLGRRGRNFEFKVACKDGQVKHIESRTTHMEDGSAVTVGTNVTELRRTERALQESEEKFRSLFENSRDAIYIATRDGRFIDVNQAFIELFGYTMVETSKLNAKIAYVTSEERERFKQAMKENDFIRDFEIKLKKKDGTVMDCLLTVAGKRDKDGKIYEYQGIVRDITERKKTEDMIKHMAFHDALTDLPNRALFNDRLAMAIAHAERFQERVAVMMLDLDKFKEVNDTHGHSVGDLLLQAVAGKLGKQTRKGDTIARMGGDEFMLIFTDLKQTDDVHAIAEKILEDFQNPVIIDNQVLPITISVGIAIYPDAGEDIDTLVKNADIAMYEAKKTGRNQYQFYPHTLSSGNK
jgi:diguanylate cyclase (GGDEF)-like protein/PAS domain S-box-containing protein